MVDPQSMAEFMGDGQAQIAYFIKLKDINFGAVINAFIELRLETSCSQTFLLGKGQSPSPNRKTQADSDRIASSRAKSSRISQRQNSSATTF